MSENPDQFAEVIRAANRTTHAVRAIAQLFVIETVAGGVGAMLIFLGSLFLGTAPGLYWFLLVLAIIVWFGGIIWSCIVAMDELRLSAVPGTPRAKMGIAVGGSSAAPWASSSPQNPPRDGFEIKPADPGRRIYFGLSPAHRVAWKNAGEPALTEWNQSEEPFDEWLARVSS